MKKLIITVTMILLLFFCVKSNKTTSPTVNTAEFFSANDEDIVSRWKDKNKQISTTHKLNNSKNGLKVNSVAPILLSSFKTGLSLRDYVNRNIVQERLWKNILESNKDLAIEITKESLLDVQVAKKYFGDDHAIGRLFSIRFLEFAAKNGDKDALLSTTIELSEHLANHLESGNKIPNGQQHDLSDLVSACLNLQSIRTTAEDLKVQLAELGYKKNFPQEIKDIFDDVFFFRIRSKLGKEAASKLVALAFEEEDSNL